MNRLIRIIKNPQFPALAILLCVLTFGDLRAQVQFEEGPFSELVQKAANQNKLLLVDAFTDWCGWCKTLDEKTFADSLVASVVNSHCISTKINMEEGFGIDLAMKYRVSSFPQLLLFDQQGHLLQRIQGYLPPDPFIQAFESALAAENHLPKLSDPLEFDLGFPDWHRKTFLERSERAFPAPEEVVAWLQSRTSVLDETTWGVVSRHVGGGVYAGEVIRMRDSLVLRYGHEEITDKLASFVFTGVKSAIKDRDENQLNAALQMGDTILGSDAGLYRLRYTLYFYQMTENWSAYAASGAELAKTGLNGENDGLLLDMARKLNASGANHEALQLAYEWMAQVRGRVETTETLYESAKLARSLGQESEAMALAQQAIQRAEAESKNPAEIETFMRTKPD